jgi:preprotein translocase subunit SecA
MSEQAMAVSTTAPKPAKLSHPWFMPAVPQAAPHDLYPERLEQETEGFIEQLGENWSGKLSRRLRASPQRALAFPRQVDAAEAAMGAIAADQLAEHARNVSARLRRDGLIDAHVASAFALIRRAGELKLGKRHFDVQLVGGWIMVNGMIAEMQTGEGKTLTATLPACTAALAGLPTHVITVNDYLVQRDCELMRPVYEALGLTVAYVLEDMSPEERRQAYASDVVYCSNKTVVFDYLRDRIALGAAYRPGAGPLQLQVDRLSGAKGRTSQLLLRGLHFAIVDEADSVLVDEARVPLIISAEVPAEEEARNAAEALELARILTEGDDYRLHKGERRVTLTDSGRQRMIDWCEGRPGVWAMTIRREELTLRALSALHLYTLDEHYLIREGKIQVIDEFTGRVMADRSWGQGLHQLIEVKEGCAVTPLKETLARISYQRFFRRYLRLGGMTGTAEEIAPELGTVYDLAVVRVPTHRPKQRIARPDRVFADGQSKWAAVAKRVAELHAQGVPVLVGTRSVATSELFSEMLDDMDLDHAVLNAKQDDVEADIVSHAGELGRITIATNMAGRGTDIALGEGVAERGGLHVILTERHESARIDRQLAGRCARQGDPGVFEAFVAMDDPLFDSVAKSFFAQRVRRVVQHAQAKGQTPRIALHFINWVQWRTERLHRKVRLTLQAADKRLDTILSFSGRPE